jgi:putative ABC transport system permease protein
VITQVLPALLTGMFDPPPDVTSVPWGYLAAVVLITVLALAGATAAALRSLRRSSLRVLREL